MTHPRPSWLRLCQEVAVPRQLALGIFFLRLFGDRDRTRRREERLCRCAVGTVGRALRGFLAARGLHLVPGYERHDLKHVLFGFGTDPPDEMRMQAYMWGNAPLGLDSALGVLFLVWTPDIWRELPALCRRGRAAPRLDRLDFDAVMDADLEGLRQRLGIVALDPEAGIVGLVAARSAGAIDAHHDGV